MLFATAEKACFSREDIFCKLYNSPFISWTGFPMCFSNELIHLFCLDVWLVKWDACQCFFFQPYYTGSSSFPFRSLLVIFRRGSSSCFVHFKLLLFASVNKVVANFWESLRNFCLVLIFSFLLIQHISLLIVFLSLFLTSW